MFRNWLIATMLACAALATVGVTNLSSAWAQSSHITVPPPVRNDAEKLGQMTQKLKKQCEDQGGKFILQSATTDRPGERAAESMLKDATRADVTIYRAGGVCTTTIALCGANNCS